MKSTSERITIDLSHYISNGKQYHRQTSDIVYQKKVSDRWVDLYVQTEFFIPDSNKWIESWHKIGTKMIK